MSKGYMYILECADGSYYTGSTKYLEKRLAQHQAGEGANHTKRHLPVKLVYYEEFQRIDHAFYREKQIETIAQTNLIEDSHFSSYYFDELSFLHLNIGIYRAISS